MPRTLALTGVTGFIGKTLSRHLIERGWHIRALVRTTPPPTTGLPSNIEFIQGSLNQVPILSQFAQGCEAVIHCAGTIRGISRSDFQEANIDGVKNLIQVCGSQFPQPRFLLLSSLAAREPSLSPYAWSKREGEKLLEQETKGFSWVIIRPPAVYGPEDRALTPLFALLKRGIGLRLSPPRSKFSLIHVDDLGQLVVHWVERGSPRSTILEVDDGHPGGYSWDEVFQLYPTAPRIQFSIPPRMLWLVAKGNELSARLVGYSPLFTTGKVAELLHPDWVCHTSPATQNLDWSPQIPLEHGLRQFYT